MGFRKNRLGTPYRVDDDEYLRREADGYIRQLADAWATDAQKVQWVADHNPTVGLDVLAAAFMGVALKGVGKTRRHKLSKRQVSSLYERAYNLNTALPFYAGPSGRRLSPGR